MGGLERARGGLVAFGSRGHRSSREVSSGTDTHRGRPESRRGAHCAVASGFCRLCCYPRGSLCGARLRCTGRIGSQRPCRTRGRPLLGCHAAPADGCGDGRRSLGRSASLRCGRTARRAARGGAAPDRSLDLQQHPPQPHPAARARRVALTAARQRSWAGRRQQAAARTVHHGSRGRAS